MLSLKGDKDNYYTEDIEIMNKREMRIHILDLQDEHCMEGLPY